MNETGSNQKKVITIDHKILAKNTFYSYLHTYGLFILSVVNSFIIARIISQNEWGFLILTLSYVNIFHLFLTFLPPSLGLTMNFYITKFRTTNENLKLKSFIKKSIFIRILFTILIFLFGSIVFIFFIDFFKLNLKENYNLFLILSPMIIINGLDLVLNSINQSFNDFQLVVVLLIINNFIYISGLLFFSIFLDSVKIEHIAILYIISYLIPFLINSLNLFFILKFKIRSSENEVGFSYRDIFKMLYKYGSPLSFNTYINNIHRDFRIQSIGIVESPDIVLGFNISLHYSNVLSETINSINNPMTITFIKLYNNEQYAQIKRIYHLLFHYILFITLFLTGLLFFTTDFFLRIVYGLSYLRFSLICKIYLISIIFNIQNAFFLTQLRAFNKVNYVFLFTVLSTSIKIVLFLLGLIYYGIIGALLGIFIGNVIMLLILFILNYKIFKIKPQINKFIFQFLIFFISLFMTLVLRDLFLFELNKSIIKSLGFSLFQNFEILSIGLFIIIYLSLNIIFKVITTSDIENIEAFFYKESKMNQIIRKILKFLKRITRA
ncbi:MAG: polysaccharide biosynthesis C-terminal domain-containing protein [Promethearchaeota archaeon]